MCGPSKDDDGEGSTSRTIPVTHSLLLTIPWEKEWTLAWVNSPSGCQSSRTGLGDLLTSLISSNSAILWLFKCHFLWSDLQATTASSI